MSHYKWAGDWSPKVDELFALAAVAPLREDLRKAHFEVQKILAEDLAALVLSDRTEVHAASATFRGPLNPRLRQHT